MSMRWRGGSRRHSRRRGYECPGTARPAERHGAVETLERLEAVIVRQGMTVFTRIDHGAAAEKVGLELRPTVVVVFGNPRAGTPAMQATPTLAIDLPLRS